MNSARPRIGVTATRPTNDDGTTYTYLVPYLRALERAGAQPEVLPNDPARVEELLARCDGLLLTGGVDVDPQMYGAERHEKTETPKDERDAFERALVLAARARAIPLLCVCRGMQIANVALGGTLIQHLPDTLGETAPIEHQQVDGSGKARWEHAAGHTVRLKPGGLAEMLGATEFATNSIHHQAVDRPAPGLAVAGTTGDGVIEALEATFEHPFFFAVQWHPEALDADETSRRLFAGLVDAARNTARR